MAYLTRFSIFLCLLTSLFYSFRRGSDVVAEVIGNGSMPTIAVDDSGVVYAVFGSKDSIFYSYSSNKAQTFSKPSLVSVMPNMYSFAMRGPQIARTSHGVVITAITKSGDVFAWASSDGRSWGKPTRLNDTDSSAPEGLMSIAADKNKVFAVWLDVRKNRRNKIFGSVSENGGVSWKLNRLIYQSPDTTVCECCKPSVVMKGDQVFVMFRNWLNGNRDLYLAHSSDGGKSFGNASKLGYGSWKLNGCPMDGGGIDINDSGKVRTVWRRGSKMFAASPGEPEVEVGEGKNCTVASINNSNIYAWNENGAVVILKPNGQKSMMGKGSLPVIKKIDNSLAVCIWENDNQIIAARIEL